MDRGGIDCVSSNKNGITIRRLSPVFLGCSKIEAQAFVTAWRSFGAVKEKSKGEEDEQQKTSR
jgi:hypothetical protein